MTQLDRVLVARGGKRPQTEQEWREYERMKRERRAKNVSAAVDLLKRGGFEYREYGTKVKGNGPRTERGPLFRVLHPCGQTLRYFPEVGQWFDLEEREHFGIKNLVKYLSGDIS